MSAQRFDESAVQGVRVTLTDGSVGTFYGPFQLDIPVMQAAGLRASEIEFFYPIGGAGERNPAST